MPEGVRQGRRHDEPVVRGIPCRLPVRKGTYVNVYGSHMGFIWDPYGSLMRTGRLGRSACLILRRMPHTLRRVEPVPGPAGYFANGGSGTESGPGGDGPRHSGGRRPITRPAINVPKPNAIDGYRRSWMPTRWLKCCPIFEATRSASIRSFSSSPRSDAVT